MGNKNSCKNQKLLNNNVLQTQSKNLQKRLAANQQNKNMINLKDYKQNIDFFDSNDKILNQCSNYVNDLSSPTSNNLPYSFRRAYSIECYSNNSPNSSTKIKRQKTFKKSNELSQSLSLNDRNIIQYSYENASLDFELRIFTRLYEKRADFQKFSQQMGREKWFKMAHNFHFFLRKTIAGLDNLDSVKKLAQKYGGEHLSLKSYGFKPDFWVTLADILTVEGVKLDQAVHSHTDIVSAWSLFVSMLFSSIRDGYYNAMRQKRNSIRKLSSRETSNSNQSKDLSNQNFETLENF